MFTTTLTTHTTTARRNTYRRVSLIGVTLAAAFGLTGCDNALQGGASGAGLGALAGMGIGSLSGNMGKGAVIGAIGGAVGGAILGDQNRRRGD